MSLTPANTEFEFEYSPPQSPLVASTQHPTNESPVTPKCKREGNGDIDDHEIPSKRTSPLQQVATPETLDLTSDKTNPDGSISSRNPTLTPMKRPVSSHQATPVTLIKSVSRFQLDSHSPPASVELEDPFDVSHLVGPTLLDFTADHNTKISANGSDANRRQIAAPADPSTSMAAPTTPENPLLTSPSVLALMDPDPAPTPATAADAPQYSLSALLKIPPVAPTYVPIYVSPDSPVKLRDSKQFCMHPPFWKRWPKDQYVALARYLQEKIDLVPFAEQENLTVEKVQHVYHAVVIEPLLVETDKLAVVGQKRIERMFKAYDKDVGMTWRKWGDSESNVEGELGGVGPGIVQITGKNADLIEVPWRKMTKANKEYVWSLLPEAERAILMRDVVQRSDREGDFAGFPATYGSPQQMNNRVLSARDSDGDAVAH
jgi:hypothetical protein